MIPGFFQFDSIFGFIMELHNIVRELIISLNDSNDMLLSLKSYDYDVNIFMD